MCRSHRFEKTAPTMRLPVQLPKILGILNITEDSFSDGGRYLAPDKALEKANALISDGADILDIGPASSHPDAGHVPAETEIARLAQVLPPLLKKGVQISKNQKFL